MKKLLFITLLFTSIMSYSQNAYLSATASKQGKITDDELMQRAAMNDQMIIKSFSFDVNSPRDASSGMPTGRSIHDPVVITKASGKSSPMFFNCLTTNEILPKVTIQLYKAGPTGTMELFETIELTNASVSYFQQSFGDGQTQAQEKGLLDTIKFTYQKITITYAKGGVMAQDNWGSRI